jgi:glutamate racemase
LREEKFNKLMARFKDDAEFIKLPAPELVGFVERGMADSKECREYLERLLEPYADNKVDAVVLGCTHYPFTENAIRRVLGEDIPLFDGAVITAQVTKVALADRNLLHRGPGEVVFQNSMPGETMLTLSRQLAGLE